MSETMHETVILSTMPLEQEDVARINTMIRELIQHREGAHTRAFLGVLNTGREFPIDLRPTVIAGRYPKQEDLYDEGWEDRDKAALVQILWRNAMPGYAPLTEDHPDWGSFNDDADAVLHFKRLPR